MHITLVGMSNIGKSRMSELLESRLRYQRIGCDRLIEQKLGPVLTQLGYDGIKGVAKWMGQPYDAQYPQTSAEYSRLEATVMQEAAARLQATDATQQPIVVDTSGSVVYVDRTILKELRQRSCVVYLEATPDHAAKLFRQYIENPKPVIWGKVFEPRSGEEPEVTLARCYPDLLSTRAELYREMAHVTIPFKWHQSPHFGAKKLVRIAKSAMIAGAARMPPGGSGTAPVLV